MRQRVAGAASLDPAASRSGERRVMTGPLILLICDSRCDVLSQTHHHQGVPVKRQWCKGARAQWCALMHVLGDGGPDHSSRAAVTAAGIWRMALRRIGCTRSCTCRWRSRGRYTAT